MSQTEMFDKSNAKKTPLLVLLEKKEKREIYIVAVLNMYASTNLQIQGQQIKWPSALKDAYVYMYTCVCNVWVNKAGVLLSRAFFLLLLIVCTSLDTLV